MLPRYIIIDTMKGNRMITHLKKTTLGRIVSVFALMLPLMFLVGCGSGSSGDGGTDSIPLSPPATVSVTAKQGELDLAWTQLASISDVTPTYEVWYGTQESLSAATMVQDNISIMGNYVSVTITGLQNDVTYYIRVRSVYEGYGKSPFSEVFTGMPIGKPTVPVITASGGWEGLLEVVWDASPYATSYKVYWEKGGTAAEPSASAGVQTVTDARTLISGVENGETYRVWVKAINTAGDSGYAYADVTASPASAAPAAPAEGNVTASAKSLVVRFPAVAQASGYRLRYATVNDPDGSEAQANEISAAPGSGTVTATVPNLTNGTLYYVWAQATNSVGASAFTYMGSGTPVSRTEADGPIDFTDLGFVLGKATAEYIWAESPPISVFLPADFSKRDPIDRLSRVRETAVGNLFCDGMEWYVNDRYPDEHIDFVFLNGGYIEGPIAQGDISVSKMRGMIDPDASADSLVVLSLTGENVVKLFKTAAQTKHSGHGNSGTSGWGITSSDVSYTIRYRTLNPADDPELNSSAAAMTQSQEDIFRNGWIDFNGTSVGGSGTPEWKLNGQPIDLGKTYRIATSSWLADGHDDYLAFLHGTNRVNYDELVWQTVAHYIYEMMTVTPYVTHHIYLIGGVPLNPPGWEEGPYYVFGQGDVNWVPPYSNTLTAIYPEYN